MQHRVTVVAFLLLHLVLAALPYDDQRIHYAVLVLKELFLWALPSTAIEVLDREIEGAHRDLLEAVEARRLGRNPSKTLRDIFYRLEDSFGVLQEQTRLSSRYPWTDFWAMLRGRFIPIYMCLWEVKDFRRQIVSLSRDREQSPSHFLPPSLRFLLSDSFVGIALFTSFGGSVPRRDCYLRTHCFIPNL
ncbi:uncharacterized protein BT62DRAFT_1011820 [Guyanagaster necrorhizus]|uniref:Uncharacterized protein n=1 Tax=Guyanagaster necrorhizus TaxID=856835 RepID=A0A9P7VIB7_9AGAR|nr:uncharacterized protein BT62DRAFT_1011820 [Guyanagaster necrorhizus MCA 3950]KAG7441234.1 hypothetical protein BT62DRAFT_1011820 [Guyanagaster necrorhizus MCA 3950]